MIVHNDGSITLTQAEYEALVRDSEWLGWLEAAGVDNSEAWEYAIELRSESEEAE